jgi:hypothetical protein
MEIINNNTKKKRCKNGQQRDPNTGECILKNKTIKVSTPVIVPPVRSVVPIGKNNKTKCKKGQRWDNKTKRCLEMTKEMKEYKHILRKNQRLKKKGLSLLVLPPYPIKDYETPKEKNTSKSEESSVEPSPLPTPNEPSPESSLSPSPLPTPNEPSPESSVEPSPESSLSPSPESIPESIPSPSPETTPAEPSPENPAVKPIEENQIENILYDPAATPLQKEFAEYEASKQVLDDIELYPTIDDANFASKIANRKEFSETKYEGEIHPIQKYADELCSAKFELLPHQMFVKNFMSYQTPYNGLLLYHGLGSGKTCSSIGIAEEMRAYLKQLGISKRIFVIASPNVQTNFRAQLFDPDKLVEINGEYQFNSCIGNSLLREIDPTQLRGLSKEDIERNVYHIIRSNYQFMGYGEFANFIENQISNISTGFSEAEQKQRRIQNIRTHFNNRLIIIDEVHNLRITEENTTINKRISVLMSEIAKYSKNMRLLLLSATPMYNSYKEIIWLTNLLNLNDGRAPIEVANIFNKDGEFIENGRSGEDGRSLLIRKLNGYVSYVRGENPYVFPYRIYPVTFSPENVLKNYPTRQMNQKEIGEPMQHIPVYMTKIGDYQSHGYNAILRYLMNRSYNTIGATGSIKQMPSFENMDSFGYSFLFGPIESLNMIYPSEEIDRAAEGGEEVLGEDESSRIYGKKGLQNIIEYKTNVHPYPLKYNYEYRPRALSKYGRIFSPTEIGKYSNKIATICDCIREAKGIVLVYSQFIEGGCIPMALALEEMGFSRYGSAGHTRNLFKTRPTELVDSRTLKPRSQVPEDEFRPAKYVLVTGDQNYSPNNAADIKFVSNRNNSDGSYVKVIIISKAASEGLDFKCIRQIHIMDPWYHMNRIEQIIGRGVRNLSHCALPFMERNVEIYMHATELHDTDTEAADLYMYRIAEKKTVQIGKVTRVLKEIAVDCHLNYSQTNFTEENLAKIAENQNIELSLSSGKRVIYQIGDKPFTEMCDYMDNCVFQCATPIEPEKPPITDTYNTTFMQNNIQNIEERIRALFREQTVYKRDQLVAAINIRKKYPIEHIYYVITQLDDIVDPYGRIGCLINKGEYYAFQPNEIADENISIFERSTPLDFKREHLIMDINKKNRQKDGIKEKSVHDQIEKSYERIIKDMRDNMENMYKTKITIKSGDDDWYKNANYITDLLQVNHNILPRDLNKYAIQHYLDTMNISDKIILLKELFDGGEHELAEDEKQIYQYLEKFIVKFGENRIGIFMADGPKNTIYISENKDGRMAWEEGSADDYLRSPPDFRVDPRNISNMIGFIAPFKSGEMVFKLKQLNTKRNKIGIKSVYADLSTLLNKINQLCGKVVYTKNPFIKKMGICILLEILMREHLDKYGDTKPIEFFPPELAIINNIQVL